MEETKNTKRQWNRRNEMVKINIEKIRLSVGTRKNWGSSSGVWGKVEGGGGPILRYKTQCITTNTYSRSFSPSLTYITPSSYLIIIVHFSWHIVTVLRRSLSHNLHCQYCCKIYCYRHCFLNNWYSLLPSLRKHEQLRGCAVSIFIR